LGHERKNSAISKLSKAEGQVRGEKERTSGMTRRQIE